MKKPPFILTLIAVLAAGIVVEALMLQSLWKRIAELEAQLVAAQLGQEKAMRELAAEKKDNQESEALLAKADGLFKEMATRVAAGDPQIENEVRGWLDRLRKLKEWAGKMPEKMIPEMRLLTDRDWLQAVATQDVNSEEEARKALSSLRATAKGKFASNAGKAWRKFKEQNKGADLENINQLAPFFDQASDSALLQRYELTQNSMIKFAGNPSKVIAETSSVDDDFDTQTTFSDKGIGTSGTSALNRAYQKGYSEYAKANGGKQPSDPMQILPYLPKEMADRVLRELEKTKH